MAKLFFDNEEVREVPASDFQPVLLTEIIAGAQGPIGIQGNQGIQGPIGPAGPAPNGTGFVYVTNGVVDVPFTELDAGTF